MTTRDSIEAALRATDFPVGSVAVVGAEHLRVLRDAAYSHLATLPRGEWLTCVPGQPVHVSASEAAAFGRARAQIDAGHTVTITRSRL